MDRGQQLSHTKFNLRLGSMILHKKFQVIPNKNEGVTAIPPIFATLIAISHYLEGKFDYGYFIFFLPYGSTILHKKFQVISSKNEGVTLIFPIQNEIKIQENCRHAFIFGQNDLRFFV